MQPMMADLPAFRVTEAHPFEHVGLDCFGPFFIAQGRSRVKRWGLIFVCMLTRAIHLEPLDDMSTDKVLQAIQDFNHRRGPAKHLYSDQGSNFIGASNEIRRVYAKLAPKLAAEGVHWHFNPVESPHFGGSWERMIQSVKIALQGFHELMKRPTDSEFRSTLIDVENQINSRPLTTLPISATSPSLPLTPNDFLKGRPSQPFLPDDDENDPTAKLCYKRVMAWANDLTKRWKREYLKTITKRGKWLSEDEPLAIDDIVMHVDASKPKLQWRKARVINVFAGRDGRIRVAEIKYGDESKRRTAVVNLAKLKIESTPPTPIRPIRVHPDSLNV